MLINEILYGQLPKPSINPDHRLTNLTLHGTFDNHDIYVFHASNGCTGFTIINDDNRYKAYVIVDTTKPELSGLVFHEAYTNINYRRQGFMSMLILYIVRHHKTPLILDPNEIVTDDSRQMFYQLCKNNKVKIKNKNSDNYMSLDELGELFQSIEDNDVTLIIESNGTGPSRRQYNEIYMTESPEVKFGNSVIIREKYF